MKRCLCGRDVAAGQPLPCRSCRSKRTKLQHLKRPVMACPCCGVIQRMTIDHVTPIAKGGTNTPSNLAYLCAACNRSKGSGDRCTLGHS